MKKRTRIKKALTGFLAALFLTLAGGEEGRAIDDHAIEKSKGIEAVASGLDHPWSLAFLPGGDYLVSERPGRLRRVMRNGRVSDPISGVPVVAARGQGGLLDIALDPDFESNQLLYIAYVEPQKYGSRVAVDRAIFNQKTNALEKVRRLFHQQDIVAGYANFGVRLVPAAGNTLFITLGDRFTMRDKAQDLRSHLGKILRINRDGTIPNDNPFVNNAHALPEIWSWGHRNPQGAALHPTTGELWISEHGPRGGDEINIARKGRNYGWPLVSYGVEYTGGKIGLGTAQEGLEQPIYYWVPSIAPSGLTFHKSERLTAGRETLFVGALAAQLLVHLDVAETSIINEERCLQSLGERIRDVRSGPDGHLYLLTDGRNGRILRVLSKE